MPVEIARKTQSYTFYRYRVPWCWQRLHELHLIAVEQQDATSLQVVDPTLTPARAKVAYQNALGCVMGELFMASRGRFEQLVSSALDFAEISGLGGLETPLLSGLLNINLNSSREIRTLAERIGQVLGSSWSFPPAAGMPSIPVIDRRHGQVSFYETGAVGSALNNLGQWISGPDAGFGGVGGFGYGYSDSTPTFNGFVSRMGELSADTGTAGASPFCKGFGAFVGTLMSGVFAAGGAAAGAAIGGPAGAAVGAVIGAAIGEGLRVGLQVDDKVSAACTGVISPQPPADPPDSDTDDPDEDTGASGPTAMPNPDAEQTGLLTIELEIARALIRRDSNRTPDRYGNTVIAGEPVLVRSSGGQDPSVTNPQDNQTLGVDWTYRKWIDPRTTVEAIVKNPPSGATPSVRMIPDTVSTALIDVRGGTRTVEIRGVQLPVAGVTQLSRTPALIRN